MFGFSIKATYIPGYNFDEEGGGGVGKNLLVTRAMCPELTKYSLRSVSSCLFDLLPFFFLSSLGIFGGKEEDAFMPREEVGLGFLGLACGTFS